MEEWADARTGKCHSRCVVRNTRARPGLQSAMILVLAVKTSAPVIVTCACVIAEQAMDRATLEPEYQQCQGSVSAVFLTNTGASSGWR
jgi:hypothetical protein